MDEDDTQLLPAVTEHGHVNELSPAIETVAFEALDTVVAFYDTRRSAAAACMRFWECQASPSWRGKYFTALQFLATYAGKDYALDRRGYNIDLKKLDLDAWRAFGLSVDERALLMAVGKHTYVVATSIEAPACVWHELSHAVWHKRATYREAGAKLVRQVPSLGVRLREYPQDILADEAMAYLVTRGRARITDGLQLDPEVISVARGLLAAELGSLGCLVAAASLADRYPA